ncbi:helix-turn-helix domain-containing protein [Lentilactobacillus hilgardii]|uniref:helix-turn-helix domain-containing protein n=1 Tax=Lentilactobacillus hilgardii TaxID=1588 RepID=UPI0021E7EC8D|nr:helix-turn-helix transcriptional regulator [Lentilactobacillus hilgardii]MCV3740242.1 helix-turn-helix transcriptional regulator [Lentilactobacillus hilgardii]
MDIKKFVDRRKALKLSQMKLCKGICTQATLSKFERNGRVPSLSILNKLCSRMGMTVDELNQDPSSSVTVIRRRLNAIEKDLMMENYLQVQSALKKINEAHITAIPLRMQFFYLRGMLNAVTNKKPDEVLFDFSQILDELDEKHQTIFTQLAYIGSGITYTRINQPARADFFFKKAHEFINEALKTSSDDEERHDNYLRLLTLIFYTANYYASKSNLTLSDKLLKSGVELCSQNHVTYYLPRLKFLAAQNAVHEKANEDDIRQLLDEALAFARLNHNQVIELRVAALKNGYVSNV